MTALFALGRDVNGYNSFALSFPSDGSSASLAANSAQSVTVPSNYKDWIAIIQYEPGAIVWVANNTTAAVPAGSSFASTLSILNPPAVIVKAADVLSFITPNTVANVKVNFFSID